MENILCIGHSFIVDNNRKFWNDFDKYNVDLVAPSSWNSGLQKNMTFNTSKTIDQNINTTSLKTYFKGNNSLYFYEIINFYKTLKNKKYKFIYIWQETWSISLLQLIIFKIFTKNSNTKIYLNICENLNKHKSILVKLLEQFNCKFVNKLLCCDSNIAKIIKEKNITTKCYYYPFPINHNQFVFRKRDFDSPLNLGFIGRLTKEKGISNLIETLNTLNANLKLVIAGNGLLKDFVMEQPYVNYLGLIPHNQAQLFYDQIDVLILPSLTTPRWKEQFGRVLVEAALSGCLVIGSSSGAIPEVMTKLGYKQFIFKENDSEDLMRVLKQIIILQKKSPEKLINLIKQCRENAIENFSHKAVIKLTMDLENLNPL